MSFQSLGLNEPILRSIDECGYPAPTPVQVKVVPEILVGKDVMAAAQTGTGKTASFVWPLLQRLAAGSRVKPNHVRALILTPTRELAVQVAENVAVYSRHLPLKSGVVYGGVKINPQMMRLRGGLDLLVATPGRLLDLSSRNAVKFAQVEALVLDEADRMLDLGFIDDIRKIIALLPGKRQNLLFSATFSEEIRMLAAGLLENPATIETSPRNSVAISVNQLVYEVDKSKKAALLSHLVRNKAWPQVLVFCRTRKGADRLLQQLERDGISTVAIHGDKNQNERTRALARFKAHRVRALVATDVAARGLDIVELPHVVNFDLPKVAEDYIHRIGRTGRAGSTGEGVSLVSADEVPLLSAIESLLGHTLVREVETGFVPEHKVPSTRAKTVRARKPKKPKKSTVRKSAAEESRSGNNDRRNRKSQTEGKGERTAGGRGRQRGTGASATKKRSSSKSRSSNRKNSAGRSR